MPVDLPEPLTQILEWLSTPLMAGLPTPLGIAGALFWLFLAGFSWWWVGRRTRWGGPGQPLMLGVLAVILRVGATLMCLLLALDLAGIASGPGLVKGALGLLNTRIFEVGGTSVTFSGVVILIAVVVATFWGTSLLYALTTQALKDRGIKTSGTVGVLLNLGRYVVLLVGIAVALTTAGINLTAIFTVGAVFAVTIGFALQNIAQNFVSGVILLVEGAIQPGDILEVEGRIVRVVRMGIRSTVVRTIDDEDMILPNGTLAQGMVKNLTMIDTTLRVRASVSVAYETDLDHALAVLREAATHVPSRLTDHEPVVLLQAFNDSGIDFDVLIWIRDPWSAPNVRSELRLAIWRALKQGGITIPFPQVDVHFDPDAQAPLRAAP